ncbi:MAG: hypothetical protein DLM52_03930 [Chthoniobacterales bacterium]|nr:MAG: hypothetical protein DLM52_03930 [Chthoniobacterales bacterium]
MRIRIIASFIQLAPVAALASLFDTQRFPVADANETISYCATLSLLSARSSAYYQMGRYDSALADLNHALELAPTVAGFYLGRGATYIRKGEFQKAESFVAQCDHGIDARGATGGKETGQRGDEREQSRHGAIDRRIERVDLEEDIFERGRCDDSEEERDATGAEDQPDGELPRTLAHDHPKNAHRIRAERHANPELLSALVD